MVMIAVLSSLALLPGRLSEPIGPTTGPTSPTSMGAVRATFPRAAASEEDALAAALATFESRRAAALAESGGPDARAQAAIEAIEAAAMIVPARVRPFAETVLASSWLGGVAPTLQARLRIRLARVLLGPDSLSRTDALVAAVRATPGVDPESLALARIYDAAAAAIAGTVQDQQRAANALAPDLGNASLPFAARLEAEATRLPLDIALGISSPSALDGACERLEALADEAPGEIAEHARVVSRAARFIALLSSVPDTDSTDAAAHGREVAERMGALRGWILGRLAGTPARFGTESRVYAKLLRSLVQVNIQVPVADEAMAADLRAQSSAAIAT